ncbi:unnamed protein product, partial [Mesorhabditis belari]|uniref:Vacuolar-sorting protein SNF8 n=1 Tax=Mesorhabditis belari TaxID=2138241 RepID=A0AAF3ECL7_9BILA
MATRRRGVGVGAVQRKQEIQAKFSQKGSELAGEQLRLFSSQLDEFTQKLEEFARKHRDEIKKNSQFRRHFQEMCASVGVDPLASGKGFWAEKLGVGDFYYELAVQIVEVCLSTNHINGGLMTVEEIRNRLMRSRSRYRKETITTDDILRAVDKLKVLGAGFERIPLGGGRFLVQSVPGEFSMDHLRVLELAEDTAYTTKELVIDRLRWSDARAQTALDHLVKEGLAWMDNQIEPVQYCMGELVVPADALSPNNFWEKHILNGSDDVVRFTSGRNVVLSLEETRSRERDCARVRTQIISEYKWERREAGGRLMDVRDCLLAYRNVPAEGGVDAVRVMERESKQRQLIKGFRAPTADLAWAPHTPILAIVDSQCNLYFYQVNNQCQARKYVNIMYSASDFKWSEPRLAWCGYVPEEESEELHMIAVYQGNRVLIINLSAVQTANKDGYDTTIESIRNIEGALHSIVLDPSLEIGAVCISPDATAVAVAISDGSVLFYMIEGEKKVAQTWNPNLGGHIVSQLFFLDNTDASNKSQEQFWKFCVAVGDGGRRLHLFDCLTWKCVGRLRFDSPLQGAPFTVHIDPSAKYLLVIDVDGANIFCVELDYSQMYPKFAAVTQIAFCHPLVTAVPYGITEGNEAKDEAETSFDDDDEEQQDANRVVVHLCGINYKNLVQLDVTLEKTSEAAPSCDTVDLATHRDALGAAAGPSSSGNGGGLLAVAAGISPQNLAELHSRFDELNEKVEKLVVRADRVDTERRSITTNEDVIRLLQQFKEEMALREERLLANVSECIEQSREHTVTTVRNALNENSLSLETSIQANNRNTSEAINQRVHDKMRDAIQQLLIPAVERTCGQLFKQLNEHFRQGIEQYLGQLRALQQATALSLASATPAPLPTERQLVVQQLHSLLQSGSVPAAFEHALNLADEEALLYVCHQVNPDELFLTENVLPQAVLLPFLQQLTRNLSHETDTKFRYMEHVLPAINVFDSDIALHVPAVLTLLLTELKDLRSRTSDAQLKRTAHMLGQVAGNMLNMLKMA